MFKWGAGRRSVTRRLLVGLQTRHLHYAPLCTLFPFRERIVNNSFSGKLLQNALCFWRRQGIAHFATSITSFVRPVENIRNVAIIAHVDHGKTTLVDALLRQSGSVNASNTEERLLDCNDLERERGITILSKVTTLTHGVHRINVVDTPGHADFSGEVERILNIVDGVLLVVDAVEGPMAQTKYVLAKALQKSLMPVVIVNKMDRESTRAEEIDIELLDLFMALGANDSQLQYTTIYASGRDGWAYASIEQCNERIRKGAEYEGSMLPVFDAIINHVPHPVVDRAAPFAMLVNSIESNAYLGRCSTGRIATGSLRLNETIKVLDASGAAMGNARVSKLYIRVGLQVVDVTEAAAGDIVSLAGPDLAAINATLCAHSISTALPAHPVDPPTMCVVFGVNSSPIAGTEGRCITGNDLEARLRRETAANVALQMKPVAESRDSFEVYARGGMQLAILVETMRREGLEFAVFPPLVIYKTDASTGQRLEPIDDVTADIDAEYAAVVVESLGSRRAILVRTSEYAGKTRLIFRCPTRGLIGYAAEFRVQTRGTGVLHHAFAHYAPHCGPLDRRRREALVSMADGVTTAYALQHVADHGTLFVAPGTPVYAGMVIGECSRSEELCVNPTRAKQLTNIRHAYRETFERSPQHRTLAVEELLAYMAEDEMLEVTPKSLRLRKKILSAAHRRSQRRQEKKAAEAAGF